MAQEFGEVCRLNLRLLNLKLAASKLSALARTLDGAVAQLPPRCYDGLGDAHSGLRRRNGLWYPQPRFRTVATLRFLSAAAMANARIGEVRNTCVDAEAACLSPRREGQGSAEVVGQIGIGQIAAPLPSGGLLKRHFELRQVDQVAVVAPA